MAARQTTKPAAVGSFSWIANERALIRQHEEQDIEDFVFSARSDLEWLNEHMADIFERNQVDMAELLKTPGKLRGKTPKSARKQINPVQGRENATNIFDVNQPLTTVNTSDNPIFNSIAQLPTNKEFSPARSPPKSPARILRVLHDVQPKKPLDPMKDSAICLSQVEGSQTASQMASQISVGDSGIWSASSNFDSQQTQRSEPPSQRTSLSYENSKFAPPGPDRDSTYRTATEDSSDPPPQSPEQAKNTILSSSPPPQSKQPNFNLADNFSDNLLPFENLEITQQPTAEVDSFVPSEPQASNDVGKAPVTPVDPPKKTAPEPRRSGRLAERSSSPLPTNTQLLSNQPNDAAPPSSPPNPSHPEASAANEEDVSTLLAAKSPSPPPNLTRSARPETPAPSPAPVVESPQKPPTTQTPEGSPSKSSSEPPTPEVLVIRKSILNFAALPAREPLTSKKKSLGMKTTRDSHVETRLTGASRASWMNRKGNGKSLGASSRQTERIDKQDEDNDDNGQAENLDIPLNRKRKSESIRDDAHKKPKGNPESTNSMEDTEEGSGGETAKATALHNKTSTQRLHDKIQQLGKLNASREARSFPSSVSQNAGLTYPELPQAEQEPAQTQQISKRTKSDPQGQLSCNPNPSAQWTGNPDDQGEWIPMKQGPKRWLTRSNTEGIVESKLQENETAGSQSAHGRNDPPDQTIDPTPTARNMTAGESAPMVSLKSPTYSQRHFPSSPLKSSFSDDWIKTPASPPKPPGEGPISAAKAHTSSVFKKAKEMLLKSSASSTSAKIETMNPGLRSWQGGNNLRQQKGSDSGLSRLQESLKQHDQQLYPDLESAIDIKVETLVPSQNFAPSKEPAEHLAAAENATEPVREVRSTRSSKPSDPRDVAPEVEESAPKAQKRSKAAEMAEKEAERAEREEQLREREERLRQAEEELRIAKEEQRRDRKEELRQAQEHQRRQKEEQIRKEKEESKRRQEERLRQEKEELKRRQQEEIKRQQEEARKAKEAPSSFRHDEDYGISDKEEEESATESIRERITSSAEPERPPSRLQKGGTRFQKTGDKSKLIRPGTANKDQVKPKIGPVSISVGTASQREMQSQRSKPNMPPSTSTLVAALKQSFENPGLQTSSSQISLTSSTSANSLRSSNPSGSKQLKSLTAAANQLKKEQEDKERKAAMKREIERRRQENQRRMEEETRRARQKQVPTSSQKTLSRTQTVANLRQTSEEPERRLDFKSSVSSKPVIGKTSVKRVFQPESTEDQQQYRQAPTKPGAPVYQQEGAKKRRTGEYDERPFEMAPPIRQSTAKKEIIPKSVMPHGYTQTPAHASSSSTVPSMLKLPTKPGAPMPQVEGVKFSKDKIRFANEATAGPSAGPTSSFKTPGAKSASKLAMLRTPAGSKDSPIYQNGELIELPDIPTDSEDEDDDYPPKESFNVPQWAESPELRTLLRQQQSMNPEEVFGPMAKLDMDAIFQNRTDKQAHRFRARTSSANWSGADRLTAAEIAADQEARQKMIAQGGWKYQPPS